MIRNAVTTAALLVAVLTGCASPSTEPASGPSASPRRVAAGPLVMPDLVGQNAAVAEDYLERMGLSDVSLSSRDANHPLVVPPENWTVVDQSAEPGQLLQPDSRIVLGVVKDGRAGTTTAHPTPSASSPGTATVPRDVPGTSRTEPEAGVPSAAARP